MKPKFTDSKLAKFFTEKHPDLLKNIAGAVDIADEFVPPLKIVTAALKMTGLTDGQKTEILGKVDEYENTEYKDYLADKQQAREINLKLQTSEYVPMFTKIMPTVIAYCITIIWAFLTIYIACTMLNIIKRDITVNFESVMGLYLGVSSMFSSLKDFLWGSSAGGQKNSEVIRKMVQEEKK
jgi:hypothetical protein